MSLHFVRQLNQHTPDRAEQGVGATRGAYLLDLGGPEEVTAVH